MFFKSTDVPHKTVEGSEIKIGMDLVDRKGDYVGQVMQVGSTGLLIDRSPTHEPALFVPFDECVHDGAKQLKLEIGIEEIDRQKWLGSGYSK